MLGFVNKQNTVENSWQFLCWIDQGFILWGPHNVSTIGKSEATWDTRKTIQGLPHFVFVKETQPQLYYRGYLPANMAANFFTTPIPIYYDIFPYSLHVLWLFYCYLFFHKQYGLDAALSPTVKPRCFTNHNNTFRFFTLL